MLCNKSKQQEQSCLLNLWNDLKTKQNDGELKKKEFFSHRSRSQKVPFNPQMSHCASKKRKNGSVCALLYSTEHLHLLFLAKFLRKRSNWEKSDVWSNALCFCSLCPSTTTYRVTKTIFFRKKCLYLLQFWSYTKILEYGKVWELYISSEQIKFFLEKWQILLNE